MSHEIERKFIVGNTLDVLNETILEQQKIVQGYLGINAEYVIRIRCMSVIKNGQVTDKAFITVKSKNIGIVRQEYEYEIPHVDGLNMLILTNILHEPITKTRYVIKDQHNQIWDVDFFEGKREGVVLAEIELIDENTPTILPSWIGKEVSTSPEYFNSNMV